MKPLPHRYDVHISGRPSGYGELSAEGMPALRTAPPADFDGPGDAWSPEHLLVAAVQSCFLITFRGIARASKVEFTAIDVEAFGTLARVNGTTRFTEIVLRPIVTVRDDSGREQLEQVLQKAKDRCLVSASLACATRLEETIFDVTVSPAAPLAADSVAANRPGLAASIGFGST